jgi:hypothetical protein
MSVDSVPEAGGGEQPDGSAASGSYDAAQAEQAATAQPGGQDNGSQPRAEALTREDYADAMRENGPPIQETQDGHPAGDSSESPEHADTEAEPRADHGPNETDDRAVPDTGNPAADSGEPERAVAAEAEPRTRDEYADAMRPDDAQAADASTAAPSVTHFHGEFKGQPLDLYTDGTRWAAADTPSVEETVSEKGDTPDQPPAGEELADDADEDSSSLLERLRREVYEESEDEIDILEKDANLVHDVFSRPPTGSYEGTSPDLPYIHGAQHSGIDAGSVATAVFTLGLVIDRAARRVMQHYENRAKGR